MLLALAIGLIMAYGALQQSSITGLVTLETGTDLENTTTLGTPLVGPREVVTPTPVEMPTVPIEQPQAPIEAPQEQQPVGTVPIESAIVPTPTITRPMMEQPQEEQPPTILPEQAIVPIITTTAERPTTETGLETEAREGGALAETRSAIIAYMSNSGTNGLNSPKIRFWNSSGTGNWSAELELPSAGSSVRYVVARTSPINSKMIVVSLSDDGWLDAYVCVENCSTASVWNYTSNIGQVWSTAAAQRRFDVAFETATGDALVIYGVLNTTTTKDVAFKELRDQNTSFTGIAENYIDDTGHATDVQYTWIGADRDPNTTSNRIALIGFDSTDSDTNAWIWNSTNWTSQQSITDAATATSAREAMTVKYAADGSKAMAVSGDSTSGNLATYIWNGTWVNTPDYDAGTANSDVTWVKIAAQPTSDDLQVVSVDSGSDLYANYWNGSVWPSTAPAALDGTVDVITSRIADFAWLPSGNSGILAWDTDTTGTTLSYLVCSPTCSGAASTTSTYAGTGAWLQMATNPTSTDNTQILGGRLNSNFDIGLFDYNGTFVNYGDGAATTNTSVSTFESYSIEFNRDKRPPALNFTGQTPSDGSTVTTTSTIINITANEVLSAAVLDWNGTNISMTYDGKNWYANGTEIDNLTFYKAYSWDTNDNFNKSLTRNFTGPVNNAPSIALLSPATGTNTTFTGFNFSWRTTDDRNLSMLCNLTIDGVLNASNAASANNTIINRSAASFTDSTHSWNVTCTDGKKTNTSATWTFKVDTTPPAFSNNLTSPSSPITYSPTTTVNFSINATDAQNSVDTVLFTFKGITMTPTRNASTFNITMGPLAAGTHNYNWTANDSLGNRNTTPLYSYVVLPATSTINLTLNGQQNNHTVPVGSVVNLTATLTAGTGAIQLYRDGALLNSGTSPISNLSTFNTLGVFNITALYPATQNHTASYATWFVTTTSTIAPTISLIAPVNGINTTSTAFNFTWLTTHPTSANTSCTLTLDTTTYAGQQTLNNTPMNRSIGGLTAATHSWNVSCTDGIESNVSETHAFTVDTTGPLVNILSPTAGQNIALNGTLNITINATDVRGVDAAYATITLPDTTNATTVMTRIGSTFNANFTDFTQIGRYNITIITNDTLGNLNVTKTHVTRTPANVVDVTDGANNPQGFTLTTLRNTSGTVDLQITMTGYTVSQITIYNHSESSPFALLRVNNRTNDSDNFMQTFAIDLSMMNTSAANVTITSSGTALFKCAPFNMTTGRCDDLGNYTQLLTGIVPGQNVSIWLTANDPGFGTTIKGVNGTDDSYLDSGNPTTNSGSAVNLRVGRRNAVNIFRSIIRFNITGIPSGVRIDNATMRLLFLTDVDAPGSLTHNLHRINATRPWWELQVTWNNYNTSNAWTNTGGDYNTTPAASATFGAAQLGTFISYNVTSDVVEFVRNASQNRGWIIKESTETTNNHRRDYASSENANTSMFPQLIINYTDITPPIVMNVTPQGLVYNRLQQVNITANVSDNIQVDTVYANLTLPSGSVTSVTMSSVGDGIYQGNYITGNGGLYKFNIVANDTTGLVNSTANGSFTINLLPSITLIYPADQANVTTPYLNFSWRPIDDYNLTLLCNLTINGTVNQTGIVAVNNTIANFTVYGFNNSAYNWNVSCTDGQIWNTSSTYAFNVTQTKSIATSMSSALQGGINWTVMTLPVTNLPASGNNGTNSTAYDIMILAIGTTVDLYMKADGDLLTAGGSRLGIRNETYSHNLTNSSAIGTLRQMTTNYADNLVASNIQNGTRVYFKFFLNVPANQAAGTYNNTVSFATVQNGDLPP
jgi:hypothetical protein